MPPERPRVREQIVHEDLGLHALERAVRLALPLHELAVQQLAPAPPERSVGRHEAPHAARQQLPAHDEARARRVHCAALLEEVPCCLRGAEEDGGRGAHLEIDDIAVLVVELLEPDPRLADACPNCLGAGGQLVAVGVEFPFLTELVVWC